jgi:hypothetical protein
MSIVPINLLIQPYLLAISDDIAMPIDLLAITYLAIADRCPPLQINERRIWAGNGWGYGDCLKSNYLANLFRLNVRKIKCNVY